jgi:hypothetical protein
LPKNAYYFSSTLAARQHHGRQVPETGLPDFQTKIPNLGKFWKALECKRLVYSMAIWNHLKAILYILWSFGDLVGNMVYFPRFGILCRKKSGNPGPKLLINKPSPAVITIAPLDLRK